MMRATAIVMLLAMMGAVGTLAPPGGAEEPTPSDDDAELRALIKRVEEQYWGESSHALMRMTIETRHWTRSLKLEAWTKGEDRFLINVLEPAKERGVATLKVGTDIWNWLPKVARVIKIPSSLMGDAWMGSHLTNDDLVKESQVEDDYTFELLSKDEREGYEVWQIKATPKPDAAVVWGAIVYEIQVDGALPLRTDYFDEEGERVRETRFEDARQVAGRTIPMRFVVQPLDKPNERTVIEYETIEFDVGLDDNFFSLRSLRS